jgi:hypothetical protein
VAVNYIAALKSTRMTAVITAIDVGTAGTLEICTAAFAGVIAIVPLAKPSFTESGGVLTMASMPRSVAAVLAGTNTAAVARIKDISANVVVNSLTVGTSASDIILNSVSITNGQTVSITAPSTITHSA